MTVTFHLLCWMAEGLVFHEAGLLDSRVQSGFPPEAVMQCSSRHLGCYIAPEQGQSSATAVSWHAANVQCTFCST
jgi:hypothetical protein